MEAEVLATTLAVQGRVEAEKKAVENMGGAQALQQGGAGGRH